MRLPIYLIESKTRQGLAETFMRFQEYYESPVFGGKAFSVEEFSGWYASEYGGFTFHYDWTGFNIPSWVIDPFVKGDFDPLTEKEKTLVNLFRRVKGDFYIIGASLRDGEYANTIKHEFAHGAFFADGDYKKDVVDLIRTHKPDTAKTAIKKMGYGDNVLEDEMNAYLLTGHETLKEDLCLKDGQRLCNMLDRIFFKHFGFSMKSADADTIIRKTDNIFI